MNGEYGLSMKYRCVLNGVWVISVYATDQKHAYQEAQAAMASRWFFEERVGVKVSPA